MKFTEKQLKIIQLSGEGQTDKDIACMTGKSVHTIKNTKRTMYEKANVRNIGELIYFCFKNGFLKP